MNKTNLLPADTYNVVNRTVINDTDRLALTMLYQPIIGCQTISLYFTLWSDLDCTSVMSIEFNHRHLMNIMNLKIEDIIDARKKLEAIGLLKTSYKTGNINNYVYQLYAPLTPSEFLTHPFLSILLYNALGSKEYERIIKYFEIPNINLSDYKDITTSFSDIFKVGSALLKEREEDIKKREHSEIELKVDIDLDLIMNTLPKGLISSKAFTKEIIKLIQSLSYLYSIDNMQMAGIIRNAINEKGIIDKEKLQNAARHFYQFENDNQLPHLIYNSGPSTLREKTQDGSKRSKMIYTFETLPPYDFLRGKYNGSNPTARDMKLVEGLLLEQELSPGVVNVLIDYVLKINDNKLNKNFVETIAGQWKRLNIKTVEEAMRQAEKEHKGYKSKTATISSKNVVNDTLPEWFNKNVDEEKVNDEEAEKVSAILSKYS